MIPTRLRGVEAGADYLWGTVGGSSSDDETEEVDSPHSEQVNRAREALSRTTSQISEQSQEATGDGFGFVESEESEGSEESGYTAEIAILTALVAVVFAGWYLL